MVQLVVLRMLMISVSHGALYAVFQAASNGTTPRSESVMVLELGPHISVETGDYGIMTSNGPASSSTSDSACLYLWRGICSFSSCF